MHKTSIVLEAGRAHQRAFTDMSPIIMPKQKATAFNEWLVDNPDYTPTFDERLGQAIEWAEQNPEEFEDMVFDLDESIRFLNFSLDAIQFLKDHDQDRGRVYPNLTKYWEISRDNTDLPTIMNDEEGVVGHSKWAVLRSAIIAARKLRYGETIRPEDNDYYSYHNFIKSDRGMAAASLLDLYEIYADTLGLNTKDSDGKSVLANALTEAAFITDEESALFEALSDPVDGWIDGYDGFSKEFQQLANAPFARRVTPNDTTNFKREGFKGSIYVPKEAKLGFTALQLTVYGRHPRKRVLEGNTRTYYVADGDGTFTLDGKTHKAAKGDMFVIPPGSEYEYNGIMTLLEVNVSPNNTFGDEKLE